MERRLVAVLAADVAGFSRLTEADEIGTMRMLAAQRAILDSAIARHRGRIANTAGDSVLAEFPSAVNAVQCAVEAQQTLRDAAEDAPADRRVLFRIGIHVGDVMVRDGDLLGSGVNVAARLEALADPGGVVLSAATHEQVKKILPLAYTDLGLNSVKNIEEPLRAFVIGASAPATPTGSIPVDAKHPPLPDKPSIAVLPFQNMSGDPEQDYFADGMVEDIITALSRFKSLFVIARNSSFTYKGKAVDIKQVGRELGVRYVLEGSVRKAAGRIRITGQLIEASTGAHIWADRFDGSLDDVFDVQDRVTESVVGATSPAVERAEIERARRKPTHDLDAYTLYSRGMAKYFQFTSRQANDEALNLFKSAIELDPDFACAYARAASCHLRAKINRWTLFTPHDIAELTGLALKAVELGRDDAIALAEGGYALAYAGGDLDSGAAYIDRALALNPNLAEAWHWGGWVRCYLGEPDAAIEYFTRATRLSPIDPRLVGMRSGIAFAHFQMGRYDDASIWAAEALRDYPDHQPTLRTAAASNAMARRLPQAHQAIARLQKINPDLRVSNLHQVSGPMRRADDFVRYQQGLREAGLPE